ncbi:hypothetical protein [Streptomyces sp. 1222.5]|uniref:hypothetical protein n=1 Tax=Streptomyces sp. 1222.5 TaxID=1881026 RepID=UPI003D71F1E9
MSKITCTAIAALLLVGSAFAAGSITLTALATGSDRTSAAVAAGVGDTATAVQADGIGWD